MSEIKLISPILDNFCIGDPITDKNGVRCCPAMKEQEDDRYILKVVSIPASQSKLDALLLAGAYPDAAAANAYFSELTQSVVEELETLNGFTEQDCFLPVRQWQVVPMENGETGYDVYILTDYRRTLKRQFYKEPLTHLNAVNLGIDICTALNACRNAGYLYVALTPGNIMVTPDKRFRISDLGFVRLDSLSYASLSERYRSAYTAPEVEDAFCALSNTMDIYALGLVLYQAYNGGALPFSGKKAPAEVFPAPAYADDEMAQIILKACDPDPANRWQTPAEMGQALISYMQKVGANDVPIIPVPEAEPAVEDAAEDMGIPTLVQTVTEPESAEPEDESVRSEEDNAETADNIAAPAEEPAAAADETVESPEAGDPSEASPETDSEEAAIVDALVTEISGVQQNEYGPAEEPVSEETDITKPDEESPAAVQNSLSDSQQTLIFNISDDLKETGETPQKKSKRRRGWIGILIALLLLVGIGVGGYYGYTHYYIQTIDSVTVSGELDHMTVTVNSKIDDSLLTVYCVANGTRASAQVKDGKATFTALEPNRQYKIEIAISGFHKLAGQTTTTYRTPQQVAIEHLTAKVGDTDGSAKISFSTRTPYTGKWMIDCETEGEEKQSLTVEANEFTLNNLTVGKTYSITITPETGGNWVTNNTCTFTAQSVVLAQDVEITEFKNDTLTLSWSVPENSNVENWQVDCYTTDGQYNETVHVTECSATFTGLDSTQDHTVKILADNQTQYHTEYIDGKTVIIESFAAEITEDSTIKVSWVCGKDVPEGGWLLTCNIAGLQEQVEVAENEFVLEQIIPNSVYTFSLAAKNGAKVLVSDTTLTVDAAQPYYNDYGGEHFTNENITFKMCTRSDDAGWATGEQNYTTVFKAGESAGFITRATHVYCESSAVDAGILEDIEILYVIRNASRELHRYDIDTRTWKGMFVNYDGYLSIPQLPDVPGIYTVEIYFNGQHLYTEQFEITE